MDKLKKEDDLNSRISLLSRQGRMDSEIADVLKIPVKQVYQIRKFVLKINNYGRKRLCQKCGKFIPMNLFWMRNPDLEKREWCLNCRRENGDSLYVRRKPRMKGKKRLGKKYITIICLRCEKTFQSELFGDDGREYNHLCSHCREFVNSEDRVSI